MRYVVVTVADGEAGVFNKKLSAEAFEKFKVKSSKLPAHITLKAPFETEEPIEVLEEAIEKYIKEYENGSVYISKKHINAICHVTVSSKKVSFVFDEMWQWINQFNCNYNVLLNNISIYKWQDNTWKLHKRFELKE